MVILQPDSWQEALEMKVAQPEAKPITGGTDVMVELNFDQIRPPAMLDLTRIPELTEWGSENGSLRIGAGVTYARLIDELGDRLPGLAIAARTGGSPQIRNRGTVGGNPRHRFARRRRPAAALRGGRRGRARVTRRDTPRPGRRVHHRPEAQRPRARRADRRVPAAAGRRPAAVLQDRYAQRDGDRRLLARAGVVAR